MALFVTGVILTVVILWWRKPSWITHTPDIRQLISPQGPVRSKQVASDQYKHWLAEHWAVGITALGPVAPDEQARATAWLEQLPDYDIEAFIQTVSALCESALLDPAWLLDKDAPEAQRHTAEALVAGYALALWRGRVFRARAAYHAWLTAPNRRDNQAWGVKFFGQLVANNLATMPAEMTLAPSRQTQSYIVKAIKTAAATTPAAFESALLEINDDTPAAIKSK
jgi:hypothetical protein